MRILGSLLGLIALVGCARERQTQFVEADYKAFEGKGTASISGQAFMKTRGGEVRYGAGNVVTLTPKTSYSEEWFNEVILGGHRLSAEDSRAAAYRKEETADAEGRFEFVGLQPGRYYVTCPIYWQVPSGSGTTLTGGVAHGEVEVGPGEHKKAVVTR